MRANPEHAPLPILASFVVAACGLGLYNGCRMVVSFSALQLGAGPATLGMLNALCGVLPIIFGLAIGRLIDRVGVRAPVMGSLLIALLGMLAPFAWPSYAALALASLGTGLAFMTGIIGSNKAVAALTSPARRAGQLGWLSATSSIGGSLTLVALGFAVDHFGHRASFALTALLPALALVALAAFGRGLPAPAADAPRHRGGSAMELLRDPQIRMMILLSAVVPVTNDTFSFLIPIIGSGLGWSASITGVVLGSALGAAVVSRMLLPWTTRHMGPWTLLGVSFIAIACCYLVLPLIERPSLMIGLALLIGLGGGVAPPVLSALIYGASPAGRQGEVIGLRSSLQSVFASGTPLAVGALSALIGLAPIVCAMGAAFAWAAQVSFRERIRSR